MPALSTALQTAASAPVNVPVLFVYLDVVDDPLLAWSGRGDIEITGSADPLLSLDPTFFGLGAIASVSGVTHSAAGGIQDVTLILNYADFEDDATQAFVNDNAKWNRRPAVIWTSYLDTTTGTLIAPPIRLATMRMIGARMVDGAEPQIAIRCAAKATVDGQRANGWKTADAHQQAFWPDDRALAFIPLLVGKELRFGVADNVSRGPFGAVLGQGTIPNDYGGGQFG